MPLMDEFKEERAKLKEQSFKKKWEWFWTYYKLHVIGVVVTVAIISSLIYNFITKQDQVFYAALINCATATDTTEYDTEFNNLIDLDTVKEFTLFDTSMSLDENFTDYNSAQKFALRVATNEIDAYISDDLMFYNYVIQDLFVDLETVLSPEQCEYYKDDFFYFDRALLTNGTFDLENEYYLASDIMKTFDARDPASMEDPVAIGIFIKGTDAFYDNYYIYCTDDYPLVFGIPATSLYKENAVKYLEFITQ